MTKDSTAIIHSILPARTQELNTLITLRQVVLKARALVHHFSLTMSKSNAI